MLHILGIRHHGVGSSAMVKKRLTEIQPDLILIEGAPEMEAMLPFIGHDELVPPLAIMLYDPDDTTKSSFYPFTHFSPEWVAAHYANEHNIKLAAIDLPARISFVTHFQDNEPPILKAQMQDQEILQTPNKDALSYLANIAGFEDPEKWWEYQFETNNQEEASDHFDAVLTAMQVLREYKVGSVLDNENVYREACMRDLIRQAQNEMYQNIVVICGAWHAPALIDIDGQAKSDGKLLKQLPKVKAKVQASWIPWTNGRLSLHSGYGAGINSPGWYEHIWASDEKRELTWLTNVARLFREQGQDISTAHVLETYKLSLALSQLRNRSSVSLDEINESIITVMCMGDGILLELVKKQMIVGDKIGRVPDVIPKTPLQEDFDYNIKSLRLKLSAQPTEIDLDLRQEAHLKKSIFFHRLLILGINWASIQTKRSKGTFKESWILAWNPQMMLELIDNAYLGNTIIQASDQKIISICANEKVIATIVNLLNQVLPASLDKSIPIILNRIDELSTISSDIQDIMEALPGLIQVQRYGDVRKSDLTVLGVVIERLVNKIIINLPNACYGLNDDVSEKLFLQISNLHYALKLTEDEQYLDAWFKTLRIILDKDGIHHLIKGCVCRMLLDAELLSEEESSRRISFALSVSNEAIDVAAWIEGFLKGSGMILIYDNRLWNLIYQWLDTLEKDQFIEMLVYLRRAFSRFTYGERKQIGEKAKRGLVDGNVIEKSDSLINEEDILPIFQTLDYLTGRI
jgi:hypothetical protein